MKAKEKGMRASWKVGFFVVDKVTAVELNTSLNTNHAVNCSEVSFQSIKMQKK